MLDPQSETLKITILDRLAKDDLGRCQVYQQRAFGRLGRFYSGRGFVLGKMEFCSKEKFRARPQSVQRGIAEQRGDPATPSN